jgi:colanic acid/amylovoran biosynthesis glycosyltransferase
LRSCNFFTSGYYFFYEFIKKFYRKAGEMNLSIAYILVAYPSLTKTFVDREITTLRKMGVKIQVFSVRKNNTLLSPTQEDIAREITYLYPFQPKDLAAAYTYFLRHHPRRFFSTLAHLLTRPHPTFLSRHRTLSHFQQGVYTSYLLHRNPVQHIHAHFLNQSAIIAMIASRLLDIPYSVAVHASSELFARPMLVKEKLAEAKFIVTCTDYNRKYLTKMDPQITKQKVRLVYHGLDASQFQRRLAAQSKKQLILSVGQLRERKGFQYLIDACRILKEHRQDFVCRIVGDGPLREELQQQIEENGLEDRVVLCGALLEEEVIREYEQACLFSLPAVLGKDGDRDGIPNVILEAMAMELPVVSTRHSGIPEVVKDGVNGLLVPPEDSAALAGAMQTLLDNPTMGKELGKQGRKLVLEKFNPQSNAQVLIDMFLTS